MKSVYKKILTAAGILFFLAVSVLFTLKFSPYKKLKAFLNQEYSLTFYDRNNELIQVTAVEDGKRREFSSLKEFPEELITAVLKAEDSRFFDHKGIDFFAVMRALSQNVSTGRRVSGASTVTMQLARIISPSRKRNFFAKVKDSFNALRIENRISKEKILELYLNNVPFGNNVEGYTSAAKYFFSKELNSLTTEEIYILAVIPRRPILYNPILNPELCAKAAENLLDKTGPESQPSQKFLFAAKNSNQTVWPFYMPHFIQEVKTNLPEENKIYLTADLELQKFAEYEINKALRNAENSRIENAACIVLENETGNVLAWVGSNDWFSQEGGQIDGVTVVNQMGSSMKPFLFALALEKKNLSFEPNSVLPDIPMEFGNETVYMPLNFNNRFNGPVRSRVALASSLNIPAVLLLSEIGVDEYLECLLSLGFDSLKSNGKKADLGLALGAGEVSLKELTCAFSVFANDGIFKDVNYFANHKTEETRKIYSSDTARIICDFLSDKSARVSGFGYSQIYETKYPSIFKTGTANQYQNIVALGSTVKYTAGVWMGNFSGNTVVGKTGSSLPASVAKSILDFLNGDDFNEFKIPENYSKEKICSLSGMKAGKNCPYTVYEFINDQKIKDGSFKECDWHFKNSKGEIETVYPAIYQSWFNKNNRNGEIDYRSSELKILTPKNNSRFYKGSEGRQIIEKIPVEVVGGNSLEKELKVFYDEKMFTVSRPFIFELPVEKGHHVLKVKFGNESELIEFTVE